MIAHLSSRMYGPVLLLPRTWSMMMCVVELCGDDSTLHHDLLVYDTWLEALRPGSPSGAAPLERPR